MPGVRELGRKNGVWKRERESVCVCVCVCVRETVVCACV